MKVEQAIDEYLEWKKMIYPRAGEAYRSFLKHLILFKNNNFKDLNIYEIHKFLAIYRQNYSPKSVYYMTSILKDLFKYYPNIVNPHQIKSPRLGHPDIHYLTEEEFYKIDEKLSATNETELKYKLIHYLLWNTGIRVGELCNIHLDNINLQERYSKIKTEKSLRWSYIMWGEKAHELLINYLGFRLQRGGDYLIDITPRQVERIIKAISENVGIQGITPHKYRHGKAHKIIREGGTIDDVSFILRHANPELTKQMYLRLDKDENISIMQKYV